MYRSGRHLPLRSVIPRKSGYPESRPRRRVMILWLLPRPSHDHGDFVSSQQHKVSVIMADTNTASAVIPPGDSIANRRARAHRPASGRVSMRRALRSAAAAAALTALLTVGALPVRPAPAAAA